MHHDIRTLGTDDLIGDRFGALGVLVGEYRRRTAQLLQIMSGSRAEASLARERAEAIATAFAVHAEASQASLYRHLSTLWPGSLLVAQARAEEEAISDALASLQRGDCQTTWWSEACKAVEAALERYHQRIEAMLAAITRTCSHADVAAMADLYRQAAGWARARRQSTGGAHSAGHIPSKTAR